MYNWDEKTVIFNCLSKLRGYARQWYDQLPVSEMNLSWLSFKTKLSVFRVCFPSRKSKLNMMRDLVNVVRQPQVDYLQFYYDKMALGYACGIPLPLITETIIGTLGSDLVEVGAVSAGCTDPNKLLIYLSSLRTTTRVTQQYRGPSHHTKGDVKCHICKKRGHIAARCTYKVRDKLPSACNLCGKKDHSENNCFKIRKCFYCNKMGHIREECLKLKSRRASTANTDQVQSAHAVHIIQDASGGGSKYYTTAKVNNKPVNCFIDFGSSCVTVTETVAKQLQLEVSTYNGLNVIKGFSGSQVAPLGETLVKITVDEATCDGIKAYIVPDYAQDTSLIIGQPYTEFCNVYVVKTPTSLKIYNANYFPELPSNYKDIDRAKLCAYEDIQLQPGINKIILSCTDISGPVSITKTENLKPRSEYIIPGCISESIEGRLVINAINEGNETVMIPNGTCVARATIADRYQTYKIGEDLEPSVAAALKNVLQEFSDCFSGNENKIGKCAVKMKIRGSN